MGKGVILSIICTVFSVFESPHFHASKLLLLPASYLKIHGSTNISSFSCVYFENSASDTFDISIVPEGETYFLDADIHIPIKNIDCGNRYMNDDLQELLNERYYPMVSIHFSSSEIFSAVATGKNGNTKIFSPISLAIAGNSNSYPFHLQISRMDDHTFSLSGNKKINIKDFDLEPPQRVLGLVKVDKEIEVEFLLKFTFLDR